MGVVYPVWEAFTGCGLCIGVFVLFRERINFHGSLSKALARGQYAAYLFHVPLMLLAHFLTKPAWARKVL